MRELGGVPAAPADPSDGAPVGRGPAPLLVPGRLGADGPDAYRHRGPYAVVAARTSGFTPSRDRVVDLAVIRLDPRGRVVDEWSTLLDPAPDDLGPMLLHGLIGPDVAGAPRFGAVGRGLLSRLEGHVVVAHRAEILGEFLAAEFRRAALLPPSFPAVDTFRLAQASIPTPNHRLATLAAHLHVDLAPTGAAADDARLVTALAIHLHARHAGDLAYDLAPPPPLTDLDPPALPRTHRPPAPVVDPWLVDVVARLRMGAREAHDPRVALYVETLAGLLVQGRIVADEVGALAGIIARAGYSPNDIRGFLEHLLEALRQAAFETTDGGPLDARRVRHLRAAATSLGVAGYFDDLVPPEPLPAPEPGSGTFSRPVRKPLPPKAPPRLPRCAHCLTIGHYTAMCPTLRRRRPGGPVPPVDRIGRI